MIIGRVTLLNILVRRMTPVVYRRVSRNDFNDFLIFRNYLPNPSSGGIVDFATILEKTPATTKNQHCPKTAQFFSDLPDQNGINGVYYLTHFSFPTGLPSVSWYK